MNQSKTVPREPTLSMLEAARISVLHRGVPLPDNVYRAIYITMVSTAMKELDHAD